MVKSNNNILISNITEITNRIIYFRKRLGISQIDAGSAIGLTRSAWNQFEKGARLPTTDHLILIQNKWNISADWLLTGEGSMVREEDIAGGSEPERVRALRKQVLGQKLQVEGQGEEIDALEAENERLREELKKKLMGPGKMNLDYENISEAQPPQNWRVAEGGPEVE